MTNAKKSRETIDTEIKMPSGKMPYPVHPGDAPFKALEKLLDIERLPDKREAVREIKAQAARKLEMLEEMYRDLLDRAQNIVQKAQEDLLLHDIPINARKDRNSVYYLYLDTQQKDSRFFSILPPEDYLEADPDAEFLGAYQLSDDSSWLKLEDASNG